MTHRKTEPNVRRCIVRFVVFGGFTFDFSVTATFITASHVTAHNERLIFCTFIVSGRVTCTMSLVIALVIRVSSALVIRAPPYLRLLLLITDFVRVSIRMI